MGLGTLWKPPFVQPKPRDPVSWTFWGHIWFLQVWLEDVGSSWGDAGGALPQRDPQLIPPAHWASWLLQNHLDRKVTSDRNNLQKRSKRRTTLYSLCWYCVLLQGKVAPSQTRETPRCIQHISSRSQTTNDSQVEITWEASGGRCQG